MFDDFLVRAALAAIGVAIPAAALGCFVVWRRMAYFGDATAHAAVLGVAISFGFGLSIFAGVGLVAVSMALLIHYLTGRGQTFDTVLGVLAHGALATGLLAVTMLPGRGIDLESYLFGDVLTVNTVDMAVIYLGGAFVMAVLWFNWRALLTATISADLAAAAGQNPRRAQLILILLLAGIVALSIKVVGAILITALLIVPAATARRLSRDPEQMALISAALGAASAIGGLAVALALDTGVGPTIVCVSVSMFAIAQLPLGFAQR